VWAPTAQWFYGFSEEFSLQYGQARRHKQTPTNRESDDPLGSPSLPLHPTSPQHAFSSSSPNPTDLARFAGAPA
jgi:hypothetical protein